LSESKCLKKVLQQLECHFTWKLQKEHIDPDELEERIAEQIRFLIDKPKVQNYNLLSYVKFLNDKKDEALENLQKAEEAVPLEYPGDVEKGSLVTWSNCAWVHYHMGNLTESQAHLEKVESIWLGGSKFGGRYYEKAKESFEKALEKEPENPEFNSGYAITIYRLEDHFSKNPSGKESSLKPLRRAVELNPDDVFIVPLLAVNLLEAGRTEEGEKCIKEALQRHPDIPFVLEYAAKFYKKKGDVETSLQHLKKALSLTPNSAFLHHQIGLCYRDQYLHKPNFFYANLDLAKRYEEKGQLQKAEETYQKLLTKSKLTPSEEQQLHFKYGRFQASHKPSPSEAIKHYLAVLKIEFDSFERDKCKCRLKKLVDNKIRKGEADAEDFAILGFIHQLNGEMEQAGEAYQKALNIDPTNEEYSSAILKLNLSL
uniref:Interferon-induced protein with tetratricopeptide repeats 5 n=1 Tax=Naja naja TaxID=35670 RepID=A0A8C7DXV9_NAJNA